MWPGALQVEQRGGVVGVAEDIGGGLVDRHRARAGGRIGLLAGMQAQRVEMEELGIGHGWSLSGDGSLPGSEFRTAEFASASKNGGPLGPAARRPSPVF